MKINTTLVAVTIATTRCMAVGKSIRGRMIESEGSDGSPTYSATIVWTQYGIPHVTAHDWGSLGFGYGYAYATMNYCLVMKEVVSAAGESAKYFGDKGDLNLDFLMKMYNSDETLERMMEESSERVGNLGAGYVTGLNRYLRDTGVENLAEGDEGCRGAEWVREISMADLARLGHKQQLLMTTALSKFIVAAKPPTMTATKTNLRARTTSATVAHELKKLAALTSAQASKRLGLSSPETMGSNAYGFGGDAVQEGIKGLLYGNPHFPWHGSLRFFMSHLTIPGEYDVMGCAPGGAPALIFGFNRYIAWTHTVSTALRFTLYELTLDPNNPLQYMYDEEVRTLEPVTVSAEVKGGDGVVQTVDHTFYMSHFGPVIDPGELNPLLGGWPNIVGTIMVIKDANLGNDRGGEQYLSMGQAANITELKMHLAGLGISFVNTIAVDRYGDAFFGDISAVPHVTQHQIESCARGLIAPLLTDAGLITLDGSDSSCEWGEDPGAPPGLFGYENLPKFDTKEYVANANNSPWLANPRHLLTGFSRIFGTEAVEQSMRTRLTFEQAEQRLEGSDNLGPSKFTNDNVRKILYSARNYPAELLLDSLVADCNAVRDWSPYSDSPTSVVHACSILSSWDSRHTIDSIGGHIFYEFWQKAHDIKNLLAVPFDAADPVRTPNTLNDGDLVVMEQVRQAFAEGVQHLINNNITLDSPWGEVQFDERDGVRIPIHGGSDTMLHSVITSSLVPGKGYANITHGNSYVQAVSWEDERECPDVKAILTYSQSTDPASDHFADATLLYSRSEWINLPFCEDDVNAQEIGRVAIEE